MVAIDKLDFETAFARLEETVRSLERGDMSLNELVSLYEEGVLLSAHCARLLDGAQLRISQIVEEADGSVRVVPLTPGEPVVETTPAPGNAD